MNGTDVVTQMLDICLKTPDPNATVAEFTARLGALRGPRAQHRDTDRCTGCKHSRANHGPGGCNWGSLQHPCDCIGFQNTEPPTPTLQRGGIISGNVSNAKAELMMAVEGACKEAVAAGHEGAWMVGPISKGMKALEAAVRKETLDQVLALIRNQD